MGSPKPLLDFQGKTAVTLCLEAMLNGGVGKVVLVTHPGLRLCLEALAKGLPVRVETNPKPNSAMADSLRVGIKALKANTEGVLVHLVDHPLVKPQTIQTMAGVFHKNASQIVIPIFQEKKGHPVLLPMKYLRTFRPEETLKCLIKRFAKHVRFVELNDQGILQDLDTPEVYLEAKEAFERPKDE